MAAFYDVGTIIDVATEYEQGYAVWNMGRKKLPDSERADDQVRIRMTTKRKSAYRRAAKHRGIGISAWMVDLADRELLTNP